MKNILVLTVVGMLTLPAAAADDEPTYSLKSGRRPGDVDRVAVLLEVGGRLKEIVKEKIRRDKLSVVCNIRYDEKTLEMPETPDGRAQSVRYYHNISAVVKVEQDGIKPVLRPERRLIGAEADGRRRTLFSPRGTLTRKELELIDIVADSLLLDRLLPARPVAVGDKWKLPETLLVALLGLDEAEKAEVQSTLADVTDDVARFELAGTVEGTTDGVATTIELKAKYRFNRKTNRIDWIGLLVKEDRGIGHVAAGLNVIARLQLRIAPLADAKSSANLTDAALEGFDLEPTDELTRLVYLPEKGDWQFTYDRRWHVTDDRGELVVLQMLDRGELIAQCNVSPLPKREPDRQITLEEFQDDVKKALGESFGRFVRASQFAGESDHRVYRVVVQGEVEQLPIQWNYYLVVDRHGRQAVFAFTIEQAMVDRFGKADEELIGALRFVD